MGRCQIWLYIEWEPSVAYWIGKNKVKDRKSSFSYVKHACKALVDYCVFFILYFKEDNLIFCRLFITSTWQRKVILLAFLGQNNLLWTTTCNKPLAFGIILIACDLLINITSLLCLFIRDTQSMLHPYYHYLD